MNKTKEKQSKKKPNIEKQKHKDKIMNSLYYSGRYRVMGEKIKEKVENKTIISSSKRTYPTIPYSYNDHKIPYHIYRLTLINHKV